MYVLYGMYDSTSFPLQGLSRCGLRYSINNSTNFVLLDSFSGSDLESHSTSELINTTLPSNADGNIGIRIEFFNTGAEGEWCLIDYVTIYGEVSGTDSPTSNTYIPTNIPTMYPTFGSITNDFDILYGPDPLNDSTLGSNWVLDGINGGGVSNTGYNGPSINGVLSDNAAVFMEGTDSFYLKNAVSTRHYENIIVLYGMFHSLTSLNSNEYCQIEYSVNNSTDWMLAERYTQAQLESLGNSRSTLWDTVLPSNANDNSGIRINFRNTGNSVSLDECYVDYIVIYGKRMPTESPTKIPSSTPTLNPTINPTTNTNIPTLNTNNPTNTPTDMPSLSPTILTKTPTKVPSASPEFTDSPTINPTLYPSEIPSTTPTSLPTFPTHSPSLLPSKNVNTETKSPMINSLIIILIVIVVTFGLIIVILVFILYQKRKNTRRDTVTLTQNQDLEPTTNTNELKSNSLEMIKNDEIIAQEWQKNQFDIMHITSGNIELKNIHTNNGMIEGMPNESNQETK